MTTITHLIKTFTLWEFLKAHWLTLKSLFKPKATITDVQTIIGQG